MKALTLLIVSGVLAAGVFVAGKQARMEQLSPLLILFWQMSGGALVVWLVWLRTLPQARAQKQQVIEPAEVNTQ